MDTRTRQLVDSLQHPGAAIVFQLLTKGPMTQEELLEVVDDASESTVNRRLQELGKLGLLTRAPGPRQYKKRPWSVTTRESLDSFLSSAIELARSIGREEEAERIKAESMLQQTRRGQSKLAPLPSLPKDES